MMKGFDMLVKLYDLPEFYTVDVVMEKAGIKIIKPMAGDLNKITRFVRENFSEIWTNELEKAMCHTPVSCFIAINQQKEVVGFSCYDVSCRNFFGPIGVLKECRGLHVGQELLRRALYAMRDDGYGYAIIGWCEEHNRLFYEKACQAVVIPDSFPGIFDRLLEI